MKRWAVLFALLLASLMPLFATEIMVLAAASLTDVLKEVAPEYEKRTGDRLIIIPGASSILARQIQEGAPADVYISADEEKMDGLERKGLIQKETRKSLFSNTLVIVVAWDNSLSIESPMDLKKAKRIAIAEPKTVPAGIYARKYLEQIGLWSNVVNVLVPTENVRGALSAVASGNVDAGIVYKTDAAISKKVRIAYEAPARDVPKISYPMAVLRDSKASDKARDFLRHLESEPVQKLFEKHGFIVMKPIATP